MSPRSPSRRKAARGKGAKAPNYTRAEIEEAFTHVGKQLRELEARLSPSRLTGSDLESPLLPATALATPPSPTIKPRLEDLINRLHGACERLDNLDYVISGTGGDVERGGSGASAPSRSIPEMLEVLEALMGHLQARISTISERF